MKTFRHFIAAKLACSVCNQAEGMFTVFVRTLTPGGDCVQEYTICIHCDTAMDS